MSAISELVIAILQLGIFLAGKSAMARAVAQIRLAWAKFQDQEFLAMCDTQYNSMLSTWDEYKKDREG